MADNRIDLHTHDVPPSGAGDLESHRGDPDVSRDRMKVRMACAAASLVWIGFFVAFCMN
jgi:hypothetical protein